MKQAARLFIKNIIQALLGLGIAGGGYAYWREHKAGPALVRSSSVVNDNGFVSLPPAENQQSGKVFVIAARNYPEAAAQRADSLAAELARKGIPVERRYGISFTMQGDVDNEVMGRISTLMNGLLPLVLVNGRAQTNPSLEAVMAEFHRARKR